MYDTELKQYIGESLNDILEKMVHVKPEDEEEYETESAKPGHLKEQSSYQDHVKSMLKKWNIDSPNQLDKDKKKEFINQLSSSWKKKKGGGE